LIFDPGESIKNQDLTPLSSAADGRAELTFARRRGRTVLAHSRVQAPMTLIRPFPLPDGRQLVQLITLGPGFCGGDTVHLRITADEGARVIVTTTAATRVLSMHPGAHAEQHVEIAAARGSTIEYYPAVTIPFPDSAFVQRVRVEAAPGARVGVLDTWALGRTARGEYLDFRSLSNRTSLHVDGTLAYLDATELHPARDPLRGVGVLAGRRYLAAGFWYGAHVPDEPQDGASDSDVLVAFGQSRPGIAFLRALGSDLPALDGRLKDVIARIAAAWGEAPVSLDRFRC
jgi:urease accessory protein